MTWPTVWERAAASRLAALSTSGSMLKVVRMVV